MNFHGKKTTYKITPGASNDNGAQAGDRSVAENLWDGTQWLAPVAGDGISDYNQYDLTTGKYVNAPGTNGNSSNTNGTGVIITNDLPDGFDRTEMTLQVESSSIGIIYAEYDTSVLPMKMHPVLVLLLRLTTKSLRIVMVMTSYLHRRDSIVLTKRISHLPQTLRMRRIKCVEIVVISEK